MLFDDNGSGMPDGFSLEESESLGMTLVDTLSSQLDATVNLDNSSGTKFTIVF